MFIYMSVTLTLTVTLTVNVTLWRATKFFPLSTDLWSLARPNVCNRYRVLDKKKKNDKKKTPALSPLYQYLLTGCHQGNFGFQVVARKRDRSAAYNNDKRHQQQQGQQQQLQISVYLYLLRPAPFVKSFFM